MRFALLATCLSVLFATAAAIGSDKDAILYSDDFSSLAPGWRETDEHFWIEANKMVLRPAANATYTALYADRTFEDADIRIKASEASGGADVPAGIVFWAADVNNYYTAGVESDGRVGVARRVDGKWLTPVRWMARRAVKQGVGETNALRVVTQGMHAAIYINDQHIATFRGFPPEGGGKIGLHAESGDEPYTWQFSELVVRKPEASLLPPSSSPPAGSMLFTDNCARLNPGWGDEDCLSAGEHQLFVKLKPNLVYHDFYEGSLFDLHSADIRVQIAELKGGTDQPAGVAFWGVDDDNYYAALLQADGSFYVVRKTDGRWLNPVPFQTRNEIKTGLGTTNRLRVVTAGSSVTVYINDKQVTRFLGFPPHGPSKIGLHSESGDDGAQWAFSELSVRQGAAMSGGKSPPDDSLLFSDDFANLDPGWHEPDERVSVSGNKLILKPKQNQSIGFLYSGRLFGDADIRVKIAETAGGTNSPGGILFWAADIDNLYATYVQADGGFYLGQKVEGKWTTLVPMKPKHEVHKGVGQVNELRVVTSETSATFYVNGRQVAEIKGYKHPAQSKIGLQVESDDIPYTWAISDLVVRRPE